MNEAVIVSSVRSPIAKARKGSLTKYRMDDLGSLILKEALKRAPEFDQHEIEDVYCGCAMPEGEQGMNIGRNIALLAGLPIEVPACTINRFCASSLSTIMESAKSIWAGFGDIFASVGVETMTNVPMGGFNVSMNPKLTEKGGPEHGFPWAYAPMGITAENVAKEYNVSREDQDAFAYESNMRAAKATAEGWFKDEIAPIELADGRIFDKDEGPRPNTTVETLAKLKPAFIKGGSVTAGNSSQLSDGAAAVIIMNRKRAEALGVKKMWRVRSFAVAGVRPELMGIGPIAATRKVLKRADLKIEDFDLIELNEAFASQSLAVIRTIHMDQAKVNIHGGAIALGHPLGCSGTRIVVTLINALERTGGNRGLATMCVGGGMGGALVIERV